MAINIRPATGTDQKIINKIIHDANINPMDLDWHRFLVAEEDGKAIGVGQVKQHGDGSRELASIAVIPERQSMGIGGEIIRTLLLREVGTLYLTCRAELESYYSRFGFRQIEMDEMTSYFRRIMRAARIFSKVVGFKPIVMKRDMNRVEGGRLEVEG